MFHPLTQQPVIEFFGRRYLRADDLIEIGIAKSRAALEGMVRAGQFPKPLKLNARTIIWDSVEVASVMQRHGAEREDEVQE
jgi:predicted DNA-binding transcriptional regulator AlpA